METKTYEQALVFAAKNGNKMSFDELYKLYYQQIFALASTTLNNADDAGYVLQQTFAGAWQNIGQLEDINAFSAWLQNICLSNCDALLRKRHAEISIDGENAAPAGSAAAAKTAGKHTGTGIISRLVAGLVAAAMIAGGVAGTVVQASTVERFDIPGEVHAPGDNDAVDKEMPEELYAYEAYMNLLLEDREAIDSYSWQKGYSAYNDLTDENISRPVVFCDIYGDSIPELIYVKADVNEYGYVFSSELAVVTFQNGEIVTLCSDYWDSMVAGGFYYYLFQISGEKTLYAFESTGDDWWSNTYVRFSENPDGTLSQNEVCKFSSHPGEVVNNILNYTCEYTVEGRDVSESAYSGRISELESGTSAVLMYSANSGSFALDYVGQHGCPAMTCEEAMAYLRGLVGRMSPNESLSQIDVTALPVSLNSFLNQFNAWYWSTPNDRGSAHGKEYDYENAADGSSNILASIVNNASCAIFALYPGQMPGYHWGEPDPMGWSELGSYAVFDGPTVDWIAENIFNVAENDLRSLWIEGERNKWFSRKSSADGGYDYLIPIGGIGDPFTRAEIVSAQFDGQKYYIIYDIYSDFYGDAIGGELRGSYSAVMEYKNIDGKNYWSLYRHTSDIPEQSLNEPAPGLFSEIPSGYIFASGVGAWDTWIEIDSDGSFAGTYHDMDAGWAGDGFDGTEEYSVFSGKFVNPTKINDYTYTFELEFLTYDGTIGDEFISTPYGDGYRLRQIFTEAYGVAGGTTFYVYTPGAPISRLPQSFVNWIGMPMPNYIDGQTKLPIYGLYNVDEECGFFAANTYNNWHTAYKDFVLTQKFLGYGDRGYGDLYGQYDAVDFALYDMNDDDTPELIIFNGFNGRDLRQNYIFSFDGSAVRYCGNTLAEAYCVADYPGLFSTVYMSGYYLDDEYIDTYSGVTYLNYSYLSEYEIKTERVRITGEKPASGSNDIIYQTTDRALYNASQRAPYSYFCMTLSEIEEQGWDVFESLYGSGTFSDSNEIRSRPVKFDDSKTVDLNWGWDLFHKDSSEYDHNIAMAGLILNNAAEISQAEAEARLKTLGFTNIKSMYYSGWDSNMEMPATTFASQAIKLNGETRVIAAIVVRGTTDFGDILTDIRSQLDGFYPSANNIREQFKSYYSGLSSYYGFSVTPDNTVLFITGHSFGGAVAGQLAQMLEGSCGWRNAMFVYTFASPNYETFQYNREAFTNVHNIINKSDMVPNVPFGYKRYGHDWYYDDNRWGILDNHVLSTYLDCLVSGLPSNMGPGASNPYSRSSIHCPVDIGVCDAAGGLMAWTKGEKVYYNADSQVFILTDGDEKYVYAPAGCEYSILFSGTDDGVMTYIQQTVDGYTQEILAEQEYENVPLTADTLYGVSVSAEKEHQLTLYELDESGRAQNRISKNGNTSRVIFKSSLIGWFSVVAAVLGAALLAVDILSIVRLFRKRGQPSNGTV